ncbi:MAG: Nramp family divalent metal transporter [Deltaproteobacteria bacterium]|nr:Nramp family divalent metal transporter [Deltaproteobacteria bacterium]
MEKKEKSGLKRFLKVLGPGFISGASDDDPACIGTYAKAGAILGYMFLWVPLLILPLMIVTQFICAKIGMISGRGLAGNIRRHFPRAVLYPAVLGLAAANTIEAGADLGAMAAAINLVIPLPIPALTVALALIILLFQFVTQYRQLKKVFKWATLALFAYIGAGLLSKPDLTEVVRATFVPTVNFDITFFSLLVALLGASFSPYIFFWLTSQEVEEERAKGHDHRKQLNANRKEMKYLKVDVGVGMLFANLITYFVLLSTAATLFKHGSTDISSAVEAARALEPIAGEWAGWLWALGLLGVGFLAVPVLTGSAAYALSEAFRLPHGLNERPVNAKGFYASITISTIIGVAINFFGINPIHALFVVELINGILAPPLLLLILIMANNREVMGNKVNGRLSNIFGGVATAAMFAAAFGMILLWFKS